MKAGLFNAKQVTMEAYTRDELGDEPTLSAGVAHTALTRSSLHAKWQHPKLSPEYEPEESTRFDIGTAAHALLLEGSEDCIAWIDFPDYKKGEARLEAAAARLQGKTPVLVKYQKPLGAMVASAMSYIDQTELAGIFDNGDPEVTGIWEVGGVWCRMRIDWLKRDRRVMLNYKTTRCAEPAAFIRSMVPLGYDLSAVFYEGGMKALGHQTEQFFLAQEIEPPYACKLIGLSPAMREIATRKRDEAIAIWQNCLKKKLWHGYSPSIAYAEPTSWQVSEDEERKLSMDDKLDYIEA